MEKTRSSAPGILASPLLLLALAFLGACQQPQPQDNLQQPGVQPAIEAAAVPKLDMLDRTALLSAVAQAASAHSVGIDDIAVQRALDGRQFQFRIRFGCNGPSPALREQWLGWSVNAESRTLRVLARPTIAAEDPLVEQLGAGFEAVEGFWIPRPWMLQAACMAAARSPPAQADEAEQEAAEIAELRSLSPRIGIAQFFSETDPRTGRRSARPYEAVKTLDPAQPIGSNGFDLVLSGRLKTLTDKRVIVCLARDPQGPPDCIISVDFDSVRIEAPGTQEAIAEWSSG